MSSNPAVQLTFTLRTSSNVRTVHLLGSWDNYKSQLPLSAIKDDSAKPGSWKGTFRFQGSHALKLGSRYWYYYIVDGYHVSHDPAKDHVVEKTTGRKLNILDVPAPAKSSAAKPDLSVRTANLDTKRSSTRYSREIPQGRALSPTRIQCPKPQKPYASRSIREADYERSPVEDLEERFASSHISARARGVSPYASSPSELSDASSGTLFSSSSDSSDEAPQCRCNKVGVTRDGRRVKLDCGGRVCGYSSETSDCSDSDSEEERITTTRRAAPTKTVSSKRVTEERRRAVVVERRRR